MWVCSINKYTSKWDMTTWTGVSKINEAIETHPQELQLQFKSSLDVQLDITMFKMFKTIKTTLGISKGARDKKNNLKRTEPNL